MLAKQRALQHAIPGVGIGAWRNLKPVHLEKRSKFAPTTAHSASEKYVERILTIGRALIYLRRPCISNNTGLRLSSRARNPRCNAMLSAFGHDIHHKSLEPRELGDTDMICDALWGAAVGKSGCRMRRSANEFSLKSGIGVPTVPFPFSTLHFFLTSTDSFRPANFPSDGNQTGDDRAYL